MNPIYHPDQDQPVASKPWDSLPFLLLGAAAFSAAWLWMRYRSGEKPI